MANTAENNDNTKKLGELIKDVRIAMMTTQESDGTLRSRPMATQQVEFDGDLWFFTSADAAKVEEVQQDQHVNLSYAKPNDDTYISVSGNAKFVRDIAKQKELWNPFVKAWFPNGPEDPQVALLKVEVGQAEYWDAPNSKMVKLAGLAKALITGQPPKLGENKKLDL